MKRAALLCAPALLVGGCTALVDALEGVSRQFDDQPVAYVARTVDLSGTTETSYVIERLTIAENLDTRAEGVRFQTLRGRIAKLAASFPGEFTSLEVRPDGKILSAIAEEYLSGTTEFYVFLLTTANDRVVMSKTDDLFAELYLNACDIDVSEATEAEIIAGELGADTAAQDVTFQWSDAEIGDYPIRFSGWSNDGDAVFELNMYVNGLLTTPETDFDLGQRWITLGVTVAAQTGEIAQCTAAALAADNGTAPPFDLRATQALRPDRATLDVISPDGSVDPLYPFPSRDPATPLTIPGQVITSRVIAQ